MRDHDSSATPDSQRVLLRLSGEISIKASHTRRQFTQRLRRNLADALRAEGFAPRVRLTHNRIFADLPGKPSEAARGAAALARVFGVQSLSLVEPHPVVELDAIVEIGVARFREAVAGRRFAVRARRVGNRDRIVAKSGDVERALGAALLPGAAGVDLGSPEVTVRLELMERETYFFSDNVPGCGGLPLGVEGEAVALLSGGFDSAVAAWQMQKRGVALDFVFCNLGGEAHQLGVLRVAKLLADQWSHGTRPRLHAVDFAPVADALRAQTQTRYWQVLLKRLMLRAGEIVAGERRAIALVTGEAMGQVSSQTLQNLAVISRATELPILRPLVGFNKDEIIALAERIGSFELSKVVDEYCAMVPRRPATAAALDAILAEEARLTPGLVEKAVGAREVFDLRSLDPGALSIPDLDVDEPPEGTTVVDLRTQAEYASWHPEGALHLEWSLAQRAWTGFDKSQRYVLCCEIGLKSAHLAELMRKAGFDVRHVRGGTRAMMKALSKRASAPLESE